jgi:hypothetical protein
MVRLRISDRTKEEAIAVAGIRTNREARARAEQRAAIQEIGTLPHSLLPTDTVCPFCDEGLADCNTW